MKKYTPIFVLSIDVRDLDNQHGSMNTWDKTCESAKTYLNYWFPEYKHVIVPIKGETKVQIFYQNELNMKEIDLYLKNLYKHVAFKNARTKLKH